MSPRIPDTHAEAWALLPWLANGRLAPEDARGWKRTCMLARNARGGSQRLWSARSESRWRGITARLRRRAAVVKKSGRESKFRVDGGSDTIRPATARCRAQIATVRWLAAQRWCEAIGFGGSEVAR